MGSALFATLILQISLAGHWAGQLKTPSPIQLTVTLEVSGRELTGTLTSRSLFQTLERPIKGTVEDGKVTFQEVVEAPPAARGPSGSRSTPPPPPPSGKGAASATGATLYLYKGEIKGDEIVMTRERVGVEKPELVSLILKRAK